jgi:prevent-host-death family protein
MQMSVSEFKAKCTRVLRDVSIQGNTVEVTNRGTVVAVVSPPRREDPPDPRSLLGCLRGSVTYGPGWDQPLGDEDWEASA